MKRNDVMKVVAAVGLGLMPSLMLANGVRLASHDGFASARGEAFVATADNPSAIYYNPAGITQLEGAHLRAGFYGIHLDPSYRPAGTNTTFHNREDLQAVPQLFCTYGSDKLPVNLGLGIYAPFGLSSRWPENTGFRSLATRGDLTCITINPVVAAKLKPNFSVAAGIMVTYGSTELEQGLTGVPNNDHLRFEGEGWTVGYNLGVLWQPHEKISLGATFRSAMSINMDGTTDIAFPPFLDVRQSAEAEFDFPFTAVFGISYRPTPKWNVEFNADYTDWTSFGTITVEQAAAVPPILPQNIPLTLNWKLSWLFEFGVTRYFDNGWHVSAGYVYNQDSVPDANYNPLVADLDRHFFAIGTGYKAKHFSVDVAYQFGYGPTRTVTGSAPSVVGQSADGRYDFTSHAVLVTGGVHF